MTPGGTWTCMNLYGYEIFAAVYVKPGRNDMFCLTNIWLTQKHTDLKAFTSGRRAQNASSEKNANARNLLTNN